MGALAVKELLLSAQDKGVELQLETATLENQVRALSFRRNSNAHTYIHTTLFTYNMTRLSQNIVMLGSVMITRLCWMQSTK